MHDLTCSCASARICDVFILLSTILNLRDLISIYFLEATGKQYTTRSVPRYVFFAQPFTFELTPDILLKQKNN